MMFLISCNPEPCINKIEISGEEKGLAKGAGKGACWMFCVEYAGINSFACKSKADEPMTIKTAAASALH